jgi:hypothetical protein
MANMMIPLLSVASKKNFIDLSKDEWGDKWTDIKKKYDWKNYTDLTKKIQKDNPKADCILFEGMLAI